MTETATAAIDALRAELDNARRELDVLRDRCGAANRIALRQNGELTRLDDAFRRGEAMVLQLEEHARGTAAPASHATREELEETVRALSVQVDALSRDVSMLIVRINTIADSRTWRTLQKFAKLVRPLAGRKQP